ncbi:MAG: ribosome maturation factor RimM [candidate division KSB1 bacterium]|nr:ribosome maturation factor RimM [candidate division KSB1 bacterium]MDZ7345646.1 ribosome maturation factor RimM [candidate division KSB1 bacterium]
MNKFPEGADDSSEFIIIGRIIKPHGVRGALKIEPLTDDPKRFTLLKRVFIGNDAAFYQEYQIARVQYSGGSVLLTLKELTTFEQADRLRNQYVQIPESESLPLPDGVHYYHEYVDLSVFTADGSYIGRVKELLDLPAQDLFVIENEQGREILIPDVPQFIRQIDFLQRKMIVEVIDGLLSE